MVKIDLHKLNLDDLKKLRKNIDAAITGNMKRHKTEALIAVSATAKEFGFDLAELVAGRKASGVFSTPKYANPDNPLQTWSGYGRPPKWFLQAIVDGRTAEDMVI